MVIDAITEKYLKELNLQIPRRPEKINIVRESVAIYEYYSKLKLYSQVKGCGHNRFLNNRGENFSSLQSNKTIASNYNLSLRNYLYRKSIGKNLNKSILPIIEKYPQFNKLKFLYKLTRQTKKMQQIIIQKAVSLLEPR